MRRCVNIICYDIPKPNHILGSSGITEMLELGAELQFVQKGAGHSSPSTTDKHYFKKHNLDISKSFALLGSGKSEKSVVETSLKPHSDEIPKNTEQLEENISNKNSTLGD